MNPDLSASTPPELIRPYSLHIRSITSVLFHSQIRITSHPPPLSFQPCPVLSGTVLPPGIYLCRPALLIPAFSGRRSRALLVRHSPSFHILNRLDDLEGLVKDTNCLPLHIIAIVAGIDNVGRLKRDVLDGLADLVGFI
jgi:hypothetical protein